MKTKRQRKIIELITNYDIETQEELAAKLVENGFNVTQATISRDIRELNLTKIATKQTKKVPLFTTNRNSHESLLFFTSFNYMF